nr:MAG TPA_asm: hypothetical protein [Caudoviricetes sp.]
MRTKHSPKRWVLFHAKNRELGDSKCLMHVIVTM